MLNDHDSRGALAEKGLSLALLAFLLHSMVCVAHHVSFPRFEVERTEIFASGEGSGKAVQTEYVRRKRR
jgi:hypothetical protein